MFRASPPITVAQGRDYYEREYAQGDYYTSDQAEKVKAEWYGRGAEDLGLAGPVRKEDFAAVLEGKAGERGEQLIAGEVGTDKHRAGWDFTASPPKGVSLMAKVGGDERIVEAHRKAVDRALAELERFVQVKDKDRERETTGRIVAAKFEHESSRKLDPQLHTHVVVMNMSRRSDGEWRALEPRALFAAQSLATATYRAELARELKRLGYDVVVAKDSKVDLAGFTAEQLDHFSQRRKDIEKYLDKRGLSGAAAAERAAVSTRKAKVKDIDRPSLIAAWQDRAREMGIDFKGVRERADRAVAEGRAFGPADARVALERARESTDFAVRHVSERRAVFQGRELDVAALKHGMGNVTLEEVRAAIEGREGLIRVKDPQVPSDLITTKEALRLEQRNIALMRAGRAKAEPIVAAGSFRANESLSEDQARAARFILTSDDQVVAVMGKAGAGKTRLLEDVRKAAESEGRVVRGFAATTDAAQVLSEVGIETKTVAALAESKEPGATRRDVWIVDEAGLLSSKQANTILEQAAEAGAKVVFVGDPKQHHAVEAGSPFSYLARSGMKTESLQKIRRQEDPELRAVVEELSKGRARKAVAMLGEQGRIVELADAKERHRAIAQEVVKAKDQTLVVAPSNAERHELNRMIREDLIAAGQVERESVKASVAVSKNLTTEWKTDPRSYDAGDRVRFFRSSRDHGIEAGSEGRVVGVGKRDVTVKLSDGRLVEYDPRRVRAVDVSAVEERRFAVGDRVQFRERLRDQNVPNGAFGTIRSLDRATGEARITLDRGKHREVELRLGERPVALDHAYAVTSHKSQGKTVDRVLVSVDTQHSRELVNREQLYVSVSRARKDAVVYTDNRKELPAAVSREGGKGSAVDLLRKVRDEGPGPEDGARGRSAAARGVDAGARGRGEGGRAVDRARDAAEGHRGREARDEGHDRLRRDAHDPARSDSGGARASVRDASGDAGARAQGGAGDDRARVGADRRELPGAGGRAGDVSGSLGGTRREAVAGLDGLDRRVGGRSAGSDPDRLADATRDRAGEDDGRRGAAGSDERGVGPGRQAEAAREGPDEVARMRIRGEEHRALRDLLPADVRDEAIRLNAAAREEGRASVITPDRVRELGQDRVRDVLRESAGDSARAEQRIRELERIAEKVREDGRERS